MKLSLNVILFFFHLFIGAQFLFSQLDTLRMDEDSVLPGRDLIQHERLLVKKDL